MPWKFWAAVGAAAAMWAAIIGAIALVSCASGGEPPDAQGATVEEIAAPGEAATEDAREEPAPEAGEPCAGAAVADGQAMLVAASTSTEAMQVAPEDQGGVAEEEFYDSLELAAACVEAEAGNQPLEGKKAVAAVILNRVDSPLWPDTVTGVICQEGQFSSWGNGAIGRVWEPSEDSFEAVRSQLERRDYPGVYFFCAGGYPPWGDPAYKIGDHYFCGLAAE